MNVTREALAEALPPDQPMTSDHGVEVRAVLMIGTREQVAETILANLRLGDSGEGLDVERVWSAVMVHVQRVDSHEHDRPETCGEAVLRAYHDLGLSRSERAWYGGWPTRPSLASATPSPRWDPDLAAASYIEVRSSACHAGSDGDCSWAECPQLRDGEPAATGRDCPLDVAGVREDHKP